MNKLLLVIGILALVVFTAGASLAGDYHSGEFLICSDCHTMHYSRSHDMSGATGTEFTELGTGGPFHYLLKADPNDLCLMCHDGGTDEPDVLGAHANGYDRSAGALNEVGGVDTYQDWMGHTLGSTATAPGGTFANVDGLNCLNCHHQHGYAGSGTTDMAGNPVTSLYRNLKYYNDGTGNKGISYTIDVNDTPADLTKDVRERYGPGSTLSDHYSQDNIDLLEPAPTKSGIAGWCKNCHTSFHGATGGAEVGGTGSPPEEWLRHPQAEANIGALGGGHSNKGSRGLGGKLYRVRFMSPTGVWGTQGTAWGDTGAPADLTPTCLSCHKGHGNGRAFGLICATGTAPIGEDGDTDQAKPLCKQCHTQG
ncbi:MAG: hypothetical protein HYX78_07295 [Armatimonadetes bacterium]|nr:hypothetical protein [Armatimonadota bacterium]